MDERHGDENALALAAGELVRVIGEAACGLGQQHGLKGFEGLLAGLAAGGRGAVRLIGLGDLATDAHHRIQRGHRFLKDHRDLAATDAAQRALRQAEQIGAIEEDFA